MCRPCGLDVKAVLILGIGDSRDRSTHWAVWSICAPLALDEELVTELVCWAAGGPQPYSGRSRRESHHELRITATEWGAFLDDLQHTLDKFAVPPAEQAELKAIVASTRADIVV